MLLPHQSVQIRAGARLKAPAERARVWAQQGALIALQTPPQGMVGLGKAAGPSRACPDST